MIGRHFGPAETPVDKPVDGLWKNGGLPVDNGVGKPVRLLCKSRVKRGQTSVGKRWVFPAV